MFSQRQQAGRLMRVAAIVAAAATMAAVSPAAAQAAGPAGTAPGWPQLQGNAAHTGYEPAEKSVTRQNVGQLGVAWTANLIQPSIETESEPVVAGGAVYVNDVATSAYNADTGSLLWQVPAPAEGEAQGTPAVQDGLVVVSSTTTVNNYYEMWVTALNSSTGATVWTKLVFDRRPRNISVGSSGTVTTAGDRAFVTLPTGQLDALSLASGHQLWRSPALSGCWLSAPSVSGGLAVVDGGGAYVTAIAAATGQVAWTADPGGSSCTEGSIEILLPAISGGTVYTGTGDGITALSLASGAQLWQDTALWNDIGPFSVTKNALLVTGDGLDALSLSTGAVLWQRDTAAGPLATFGSLTWALQKPTDRDADRAVAFNPATGARVFAGAVYADYTAYLPPVVSAGHVYLDAGTEIVCLALPASG
jgi:outer membrane protein assembly factor BamB